MQKSFVPALFLRPKEANQSAPLRRMVGATATVSTFVTVVGQPYSPTPAGKRGLSRGLPCFPSSDSMSAVSSPQMYAPGSVVDVDVKVDAGAAGVLAEVARRVRLVARLIHEREAFVDVLAADVDVAALARIAAPAMRQPSSSLCHLCLMISRSLHVPGSDSSALMTR